MTSMGADRKVRAAAVTTWVYAAGFGVPTVPVAVYLTSQGRLPTFLDLFPMYGGPWSSRLKPEQFVVLLTAFLVLTGAAAWSAWGVSRGRKSSAVVNLALLPLEAFFWVGFALPLPWLAGIARVGLLAAGWRSLDGSRRARQAEEATGGREGRR
jgi:hypothetical protein